MISSKKLLESYNLKNFVYFSFLILFISLSVFSQYASAVSSEITFDASNATICDSNPCPLSLPIAPGSDRMIIIVSTVEGPLNLIDSIDITGGTSQGILVGTQQVGSGSTLQSVEMWRIMEADISDGVNTVTINYDGTPSDAGITLLSFSGIKQQPEEAKVFNSVTTDPVISTEITPLTDESLIVSAVGHGKTGVTYALYGADQIERSNFAIAGTYRLAN